MNQKSTTTWVIAILVIIVIIGVGWWYFASQSSSPNTTSQNQSFEHFITSFSLGGLNPVVNGSIDNTNYAITLTVPKGTDLTKLTPTITLSSGATVSPASGTVENFTSPVAYTVTGQDGQTQTYTVSAVVPADSVSISSKTGVGQFLTDSKGMTLYYFLTDKKGSGQSACTASCATLWPPFSAASATNFTISTPLKASDFSTITRADGQSQLAYKGWPMYYNDTKASDTNGQGINKVWYVIKP